MLWLVSRFVNLASAAALALGVIGVSAVRAQEAVAYIVTYIEAAPAMREQAAKLVDRYAAAGREAAGNLRFEGLQRIDRPNQFAFIAAWKDQQAAQTYAASEATKQFRDKLEPSLSAPIDERLYSGLEVAPTSARDRRKGAIYAVTHVDIIPPKKDDSIAALKEVSAPSRAEVGNLRYEVLQQNSRPNHFTVVEIWHNRKALEKHEVADHIRKLRDLLLPMQGALYDQRLYRSMD